MRVKFLLPNSRTIKWHTVEIQLSVCFDLNSVVNINAFLRTESSKNGLKFKYINVSERYRLLELSGNKSTLFHRKVTKRPIFKMYYRYWYFVL